MTQAWPADAVERRSVATLVPYARNARTHSPTQIDQLARLITAYGWTNPVLVDEASNIIAGHGRILAAQKLGIADVPVMVARGWSRAQVRAYVLADNASAAQAGWDDEILKLELGELSAEGFDLDLTGFSEDAVEAFMAPDIDPEAEWQGMPEFNQPDKTAFQTLAVHFKDQNAVDEFARLIGQRITNKTRFTWYPQIEIDRYADKRYANEP